MKTAYKFLNVREGVLASAYDGSPWTPGVWRHERVRGVCEGLNCSRFIGDAQSFVEGEALALVEYDGALASEGKLTCAHMRVRKAWRLTKDDRDLMAAAWAEYDKARAPAWAEYDKARPAAWAKYDKAYAAAGDEYDKACAAAGDEYEKACAAAKAEYDKACAAAWAEYEKARAPAWAEYGKARAAAKAKYHRIIRDTICRRKPDWKMP